MRATRNTSTALERLCDFLGLDLETSGHGRRAVTFERPEGDPVTFNDRTYTVLYSLLHAATAPEELGGLGMCMDEIRPHVKLTRVPDKGLSAHESTMFQSLVGR